jgi:ribulose-phosphate 3-epimerase
VIVATRTVAVVPSLLAGDLARLGDQLDAVKAAGCHWVSVDVMDGHFVPNLTIGVPVVKSLRKATTLPLDVHLMITDPDRYIEPFIEAGASMVSVHVEVLPHLHRTIGQIKKLGAKAGVVLNPSTPVSSIEEVAADVDFVLVMSVNPGFGGQVFIPRSLHKIRAVRALLDAAGNSAAPIEVDGGIDLATVASVVEAGAEWLVAGNAIFGSGDAEAAARALKDAAVRAARGGTS